MANNTRFYYSLPTDAPHRSRSGSRRPPLTPSTMSSPCITTYVPLPRRDSASSSGSPTKAHALLAKVVSSPTIPRGETAPHLVSSPTSAREQGSSPTDSERPTLWRTESERYVRQYRQQGKHSFTGYTNLKQPEADQILDGYISFPDFEQFSNDHKPYDAHCGNTAVKT